MIESRRQGKLSIILLSYYSGQRIVSSYEKIRDLLDSEKIPFEFIVMDDGSRDDSYRIALDLEKREERVFAYQLSRNCTSHYSIFAGLSVCTGDCAMPMVDDEQQPYHTIIEMYRLWQQGEQVIVPHRICRDDPWRSRIFSQMFYGVMNCFSEVKYPVGGADLFFIDREVIDIMNTRIHPINTASIAEVLRLGFSPYFYPYERPLGLNQKKSRWSLRKKLKLAKDIFFSSSTFPISLISRLGIFFAGFSGVLILFYAYIALFSKSEILQIRVPGWTSIILIIAFFNGLILLSLGVIAEYIWRIYEEVKARPGYLIRKKEK